MKITTTIIITIILCTAFISRHPKDPLTNMSLFCLEILAFCLDLIDFKISMTFVLKLIYNDLIEISFFQVVYIEISQWDVAKLISEQPSGKERFERYLLRFWEEVEQRIRNLQAEGKNVTQAVFIANVDNFSLEKHGCIQCTFLALR